MVKTNFLSREPVFRQAEFVGRAVELDWLADKLGRQTPQNCNLIGEPRSGKTSLLFQAYKQQIGLLPGEKGLHVWVRLAELYKHDSLSFWRLLAKKLCKEQIKAGLLPDFKLPKDDVETLFEALDECLEQLIEETGLDRVLVLLDDFDLLLGENGIGKWDLDWLRSLATRYGRSLAFVIASTDSLLALTDPLSGPAAVSPFANIFLTAHIGLLDRMEAEQLCQRAAAAEQLSLTDADIDFLLAEAGRHPDLLKIAFGYLFAAKRKAAPNLYGRVAGEIRLDVHVNWLSRRLLQRLTGEETAVLEQLITGQPIAEPMLFNHLQKLGLVEQRADQPALFADAFRYWVRRELGVESGEETAVSSPHNLPFTHLPDERQVIIAGQTIQLTSLENRLLVYLSQHVNQVCTTQDLLENVWSPQKSESVVEKGINRLRKKIEQDPQRPRYILSLRGEGYSFRT